MRTPILTTIGKYVHPLSVDDNDYDRIAKYKWHLHINDTPRTRIFLHPLMYDAESDRLVENTKENKVGTWIPLDRFVFRITSFPTNLKIMHMSGGIDHKRGNQCDCQKAFMQLLPRDPDEPLYKGIKRTQSDGLWYAYTPSQGMVSNTFYEQESAARAYDKYIVQTNPTQAVTNFYYTI